MKKFNLILVCLMLVMSTAAIAQTAQCITNATANGVEMPVPECGYISFSTVHELLADPGVPSSVKAYLKVHHRQWICGEGGCSQQGGPLGGSVEVFNSTLDIEIQGAGPWAGYQGNVSISADTVTATGPRDPFAPQQDFPNMMVSLNAEGFGVGDLDFIRITAGTNNGFQSDGWTSVQQVGPNEYEVNSQFNIEYSIELMGNPMGPLAGLEGVSIGFVDMVVSADEDQADN